MEAADKKSRKIIILIMVLLVFAAVGAGYFLGRIHRSGHVGGSAAASEATTWTCSMHPQIRQPKPGQCPICFMDLIPVESGTSTGGTVGERELHVTSTAAKLMEVEVRPVERRPAEKTIRMVGKIDYDETRLEYLTAWMPGRLDRLFVDYTGTLVRQGDHMVEIYSPELLAAQEELIQAAAALGKISNSESTYVQRSTKATLEAAREKLRLLGLTVEQVARIESSGKTQDTVTLYAPAGGVVIEKHAKEGMYVQTGMRIYTIADLSKVWVKLEAYESDLPWLRYGQKVEFVSVSLPGETFEGTIAFIDPILDERTRTVSVRVNAANPEGKLKPGMFVKALVVSQVAGGGKVMDKSLEGKWMCPMHPEIVKDVSGSCELCGMPLETSEELGYANAGAKDVELPLLIPAWAPLITGDRAVVYVQKSFGQDIVFEGREVVLGPKAGDSYIVKEGLVEGELVVTRGNFKIDSALQIQARPSMMSEEVSGSSRHLHTMGGSGEQTLCPVMDAPINKEVFVMYKGKKVYFCCPGCDAEFQKDPEKYLHKLPQFQGEQDQ